MAIRECPECCKPISTNAAACPHCGCPLSGGKKKRSYLWPLFLILFVLGGVALMSNNPDSKRGEKAGEGFNDKSNVVPLSTAPRCNASQADVLVGKLINQGIFLKIETKRDVPRIYVLEPWNTLTIDEKKAFDNAVQCHLMRGIGKPVLAVYHDGRTGKEVAETGPHGFSMN